MFKILACTTILTISGTALAQASYGEAAPQVAAVGYPACSATVINRCIRFQEPAVRAKHSGTGGPESELTAILSREDAIAAAASSRSTRYPPCSARVQDRCRQVAIKALRSPRVREPRLIPPHRLPL